MKTLWRWLGRVSVDQWRAIDEAYRKEEEGAEPASAGDKTPSPAPARRGKRRAPPLAPARAAQKAYDWRVIVVLIIVAISLSLQEYYGERTYYQKVFPFDGSDPYWMLKGFAWWSGWRLFGYVIIPTLAILLMPGERLRDYYISPRGFFRHLWIYVVLFLLVLPAVIIAAQTQAFYRTYPFYKLSNRSYLDLLAWEGLYAVQFLSLEFFFRGFILHGLGRAMGSKAVFVMAVPYCMIHFGKPFPETMGAIFAGIILGTLAMRTRSIWGGVLIHVGVAVTMDLLALQHCPPAGSGLPCKGH